MSSRLSKVLHGKHSSQLPAHSKHKEILAVVVIMSEMHGDLLIQRTSTIGQMF